MYNLHSIDIKQQTDPFGEGTLQKVGKSWVEIRNILNLRPLRFFTQLLTDFLGKTYTYELENRYVPGV